jgi:acetylornithine deacetylase/succinyl-diaminopimelate desuccinylase-like protein
MKRTRAAFISAALLLFGTQMCSAATDGEAQFRALYKELIETNTTLSAGSCTLAAERMAAHLKEAGFSDTEVQVFTARRVEKLAAQFWPGAPVLPILQAGATDGEFTSAVGISTHGIEPLFMGHDLGNIHGLNEYVTVESLMECRAFLYRLVRIYAEER